MKLSISPLTILGATYASVVAGLTIQRRAVDFFDPAQGGGSIFDNATFGGEPLNVSTSAYSHPTRSPSLPVMVTGISFLCQVIISGLSSLEVLTDDGVMNYAKAIGL